MAAITRGNESESNRPSPEIVNDWKSWRSGLVGGGVLATLGALALLGQAWGMRTLVRFGAEREAWVAAQAEHAGVVAEHQKVILERQSELERLRQAQAEASGIVQTTTSDRDRLVAEVTRLRSESEVIRQGRDEAVRQQQAANKSAADAKIVENAARADSAIVELKRNELRADCDRLTTDRVALQQSVTESGRSLTQQQEQLKTVRQQQADLTEQVDGLVLQVQATQARLVKASAAETDSISAKESADKRLAGMAADAAKAEADLSNARKSSVALQSEVDQLNSIIVQRRKEASDLDVVMHDGTKKSTALADKIAEMQGRLGALNAQAEVVERDVQRGRNALATLEASRTRLEADLNAIRAAASPATRPTSFSR